MEKDKNSEKQGARALTRREALKISGLALGGLAIGGAIMTLGTGEALANDGCACPDGPACNWGDSAKTQRYSYLQELDPFYPVDATTKTTITP
ncbi:MAG: hypothetical protein M0Z56_02625, partial [Desulfobacteraceae bacterium]|nr:hypothetical protein [Desulfobacteraceae bacterium]